MVDLANVLPLCSNTHAGADLPAFGNPVFNIRGELQAGRLAEVGREAVHGGDCNRADDRRKRTRVTRRVHQGLLLARTVEPVDLGSHAGIGIVGEEPGTRSEDPSAVLAG